jgi:hypothetical protein
MNKPDQVIAHIIEVENLYAELLKAEGKLKDYCRVFCDNLDASDARMFYIHAKSALQERLYEDVVINKAEGVLE